MANTSTARAPLFTPRHLIALFLPLIAEQALSITIGLADTFMVSSIGEAAVSGVSLVDSVNTLLIQIFAALATGGAVVTSQYIGRRDHQNAQASSAQILCVMLLFSCAVSGIVVVLRHAILRGVFGAIDADVMAYAETYFLLSALSYPFIALYSAGAALFRAQGSSRISMLCSLVMNLVNIGGNALLIYGFRLGVMGAALASLVSRVIACGAVLWLLQRPGCALRVESPAALKPNGALVRRILAIGIPSGVENGMFQFGKLAVSHLTSSLGTAAIAANAVAGNYCSILNIPANAVGLGIITVVGQCLGAGEKQQAKRYAHRLMLAAYAGAWAMNLASLWLNPYVMELFNLSPEATALGVNVMLWFNLVSLVFWPSSFTTPNILRAAGDARYTMLTSVFSMWVFRVVASYVLVLQLHMGLLGVWMGMFIDWVFRSAFFLARFWSGKWAEKKVI